MAQIKNYNNDCKVATMCEEPTQLIEMVSATFRIKSNGVEVVVTAKDMEDLQDTYYWNELATSRPVSSIIINELSKQL